MNKISGLNSRFIWLCTIDVRVHEIKKYVFKRGKVRNITLSRAIRTSFFLGGGLGYVKPPSLEKQKGKEKFKKYHPFLVKGGLQAKNNN